METNQDDISATELLRQDHAKVKDLFTEFEEAENPDQRGRIVEQALVELAIHAKLEEELFYPAARRELGDQKLDEAEEEHHVAELLMSELVDMSPGDDRFDAKFTVLAKSVKHHIEKEEDEIFPRIERSGLGLDTLGAEMLERKQDLLEELTVSGKASPVNSRDRHPSHRRKVAST